LGVAADQTKSDLNVLWVVDEYYVSQDNISQTIKDDIVSLASILDLSVVKYRMAVTTTDIFTNNGKLVCDEAGITSADSSDPQHSKKLMEILNNIKPTSTSFWRQGLQASLTALKDSTNVFEAGSTVAIIYLSGEDDYSCASECYGVQPWDNKNWVRNPPSNYVDQFQSLQKDQNISISLYPIVGLPNTDCTIEHVGQNYQMAQNLMKTGLTASSCLNDLKKNIANVGMDIVSQLSK
jgi:hypothetical protein